MWEIKCQRHAVVRVTMSPGVKTVTDTEISVSSKACQKNANMRLPHIWHFAAFYAYFSKVSISYIFPHILTFSAAINILCSYLIYG